MNPEVKQKNCQNPACNNRFTPYKSTDKYCSFSCFRACQTPKKLPYIRKKPEQRFNTKQTRRKPVFIPDTITREWFESLSREDQKRIGKRLEDKARYLILSRLKRRRTKDATGNYITQVHHCWQKGSGSQIPIWYWFQEENLLPLSQQGHEAIHNKIQADRTEQEKQIFAEAEKKKAFCIEDHEHYSLNKTAKFLIS